MFSLIGKSHREIRNCKKPHALLGRLLSLMLGMLVVNPGSFIYARSPINEQVMPPGSEEMQAAPLSSPRLRRFSLGEVLYLRHCADCHGWTGRGNGPLAAILPVKPRDLREHADLFTHNSDAQIIARILYGTPLTIVRPEGLPYKEDEVTALLIYLQRLPTIQWVEVNRGKEVYDSLCAACHGLYGRGDGMGAHDLALHPRDLSDVIYQRQVRDETLVRTIRDGKGAMPGAGDVLTAHEIRSAVAFLRLLSPGYELYTRFCTHCHGVDGVPPPVQEGRTLGREASGKPPRFEKSYFRRHTTEQIRTAIPHMHRQPRPMMPHFVGQLSADEAGEIVRYLRTR